MAPYKSHRELESQRLQLYQSNHRVDQAQRKKISLYGESELKNRIYQESHTRTCQEVDKLRRICREETHRATRLKQERDRTIVSVLLSQIWDLQKNQAKYLSEEQECHDPFSPISLEESYVPTKPTYIPSTRSTYCLDCRPPPNTRNLWVFQDIFFESLPLREGQP